MARAHFFGVDPKKVPPSFRRLTTLSPATRTPHPRPLSRKGRGEQELGRGPWGDTTRPTFVPPWGRADFFRVDAKKVPLFSAPKKPKKSKKWSRMNQKKSGRLSRMDLFPKCVKNEWERRRILLLSSSPFSSLGSCISRTKRETSDGCRLPHFMRESAQVIVRSVMARVTPT